MASDDDKPDWSGILTGVLLQILLFPASALIFIWMASTTWGWFLEPRFGDGPTTGEWFGISLLHLLLTYEISDADEEKSDEKVKKGAVAYVLGRFLKRNVTLLIAFGVAAALSSLMGWR